MLSLVTLHCLTGLALSREMSLTGAHNSVGPASFTHHSRYPTNLPATLSFHVRDYLNSIVFKVGNLEFRWVGREVFSRICLIPLHDVKNLAATFLGCTSSCT